MTTRGDAAAIPEAFRPLHDAGVGAATRRRRALHKRDKYAKNARSRCPVPELLFGCQGARGLPLTRGVATGPAAPTNSIRPRGALLLTVHTLPPRSMEMPLPSPLYNPPAVKPVDGLKALPSVSSSTMLVNVLIQTLLLLSVATPRAALFELRPPTNRGPRAIVGGTALLIFTAAPLKIAVQTFPSLSTDIPCGPSGNLSGRSTLLNVRSLGRPLGRPLFTTLTTVDIPNPLVLRLET